MHVMIMQHKFQLLCIIFLLPIFLHGWSYSPHEWIATIAQKRLSYQATKMIKHYLSEFNGNLANVSTWADKVRYVSGYTFTRPFHYVNTPHATCNFQSVRDCNDQKCIVGAIYNYTSIIVKRASHTFNNTLDAIRFLVHFMGDIAQPLHVGWESNKGGNSINIRCFTRKSNLHECWDKYIPERRAKEFGGETPFIQYLEKKLSNEWKDRISMWLKCPRGDYVCPDLWANESSSYACSHCYAGVKEGDELGDEYYKRAWPVLEEQIAKFAVRLAAVLNLVAEV